MKDFERPSRPYNTYVLPADGGQFYVYLLPAQMIDGVYPLGGDVRYLFSAAIPEYVGIQDKSIYAILPDGTIQLTK